MSGATVAAVGAPAHPSDRGVEDEEEPYEASDDGARQHRGFFLRFTLGVGWGNMKAESGESEASVSGAEGFFTFDIGGALTERLILHGRLGSIAMVNPTLEEDGDRFETTDTRLRFAMLGVGLTYYVLPANVYFTGVIGAVRAAFESRGETSAFDKTGFELDLDVGKEWWVGDYWGLGVAARFAYVSIPPADGVSASNFKGLNIGLLFSATYN
jgi:hypothetical protein